MGDVGFRSLTTLCAAGLRGGCAAGAAGAGMPEPGAQVCSSGSQRYIATNWLPGLLESDRTDQVAGWMPVAEEARCRCRPDLRSRCGLPAQPQDQSSAP
jgi:hypothetical protein